MSKYIDKFIDKFIEICGIQDNLSVFWINEDSIRLHVRIKYYHKKIIYAESDIQDAIRGLSEYKNKLNQLELFTEQ